MGYSNNKSRCLHITTTDIVVKTSSVVISFALNNNAKLVFHYSKISVQYFTGRRSVPLWLTTYTVAMATPDYLFYKLFVRISKRL